VGNRRGSARGLRVDAHARHSRTMQANPVYEDVALEVGEFFRERLGRLNKFGVAADQVALDPGIGLGRPASIICSCSRAAPFYKFGAALAARSLAQILSRRRGRGAPAGGARVRHAGGGGGSANLRTHDVAATAQALRMAEAVLAWKNNDGLDCA